MTRTDLIAAILNEKSTVTVSYNAAHALNSIGALAGLEDVTEQVDCYDRISYRATLQQWLAVAAIATAARDDLKGSERATLTAAINRMPPLTEKQIARAARRAARDS